MIDPVRLHRGGMSGRMGWLLFAGGVSSLLLFSIAAHAAPPNQQFLAELDPLPFGDDPATLAAVAGEGSVTAVLTGNTLVLTGKFDGLPSAAAAAHLQSGLATGVPGPVIGDLTISPATSGAISGHITLNAAQVKALGKGAVYVQINSVKDPDGNLWGWFLSPAVSQQ